MQIQAIKNISNNYYQRTNTQNFKKAQEIPNDTVEISSQKSSNTSSIKTLAGIAGAISTVYLGIVGLRAMKRPSMEKIQKSLSEIFRRNVEKKEAKEIIDRYKELFKINEPTEFCEKMFNQIKEDYGYKDLKIRLIITEQLDKRLLGCWQTSGLGFLINPNNVVRAVGNGEFNNKAKKGAFEMLMHEFQHAKQTEYGCRADFDEYIKSLYNPVQTNNNLINALKQLLSNKNQLNIYALSKNMSVDDAKKLLENDIRFLEKHGWQKHAIYSVQVQNEMNLAKKHLTDLFGSMEKFKPGTKEYELGKSYIDNFKHYKHWSNPEEYKNQTVEKEAFDVSDKAGNIAERFRPLWKLFKIEWT